MLLFKNGLKNLIKDYIQFIIFVMLVALGVIFTSTFGIASSNLIRIKDRTTSNFESYDYSFKYTSSGYNSNDTQTLNPWFAFNTNVISSGMENYNSLSIGKDKVLKPFDFKIEKNNNGEYTYKSYILEDVVNSSSVKAINFGFGDVESDFEKRNPNLSFLPNATERVIDYNEQQKIDVVKSGEFGRFYRFNFDNAYFKNSLIGKLYQKNNYFNGTLNEEQKINAKNIFDYMFYLNNSSITSLIKNEILNEYISLKSQSKNDNVIEQSINNFINFKNEDSDPKTLEEVSSKGYNGKFGRLIEGKYFLVKGDFSKAFYSKTNSYAIDQLKRNGTYLIKDFESTDLFWNYYTITGYLIEKRNVTNRNLFQTYFNLIADLTKFKIELTSEVVMWNNDGQKFRFISAFYNYTEGEVNKYKFFNEKNYTFYKSGNFDNQFTWNSFMISSGFAKKQKFELGKTYNIVPGKNSISDQLRLDAIGTDAYNMYPTIYEEDLITNQNNEAIIYLNSIKFESYFNNKNNTKSVEDSKYQDVSRTYMRYVGKENEIENNVELYKLYLADNITNLKVVSDILNEQLEQPKDLKISRANIQSVSETSLLALRSGLLQKISLSFMLISIIFCSIFLACITFMLYTIVKKIMINQRGQIGNLKSLGYSNSSILFNYILYLTIPTILIVPLAWIGGIFLQIPIMAIFEIYFNIPEIFTIDYMILIFIFIGFVSLNTFVVGIIAYQTIKQPPLKLMAPSKSYQPNLFVKKIISKLKFSKFNTKLRATLISTSVNGLLTFFGVITFSSIILTLSSLLPSTMDNMKTEYFKRIKYNNDYNYVNVISNNPMTRNSFYNLTNNVEESNLKASVFNTYIKEGNEFINLQQASNLKPELFIQYFEDIMYYNLLSFKGITLSPAMLENIVKVNSDASRLVKKDINNFTCQVLPSLFGQEMIVDSTSDFNDCIKNISNNILPSTIKQMWDEDEQNYKNFTFNFSTISVNENEDQMYTRVLSKDEKKNLDIQTYGLDLQNPVDKIDLQSLDKIKYVSDTESIPVIISKKMAIRGYKVGDELSLKTTLQKLAVKNDVGSEIIKDSDWKYNVNGESINLNEIPMDKFSYVPSRFSDSEVLNNKFYYLEDKEYKQYYNPADIELTINVNEVDKKVLEKVNQEYLEYSNIDLSKKMTRDSLTVKPFDIFVYENNMPTRIGLESLIGGTNSWINIALQNGLLFDEQVDTYSKPLKIVDIQKIYNGDKVFMDQHYANEMLGFSNIDARVKLSDKKSINIWSNAKFSSNEIIADQYSRYLLAPNNMNNSTSGFSRYMKELVGNADYVLIRKQAVQNLIHSTLAIVFVLIVICIITSVIVIYLITDMFVGRYKRFMGYMRIQGYSMKEINNIVSWIFIPLTIGGGLLGIGIVMLILFSIVPKALLFANIAVGIIISWWMLLIIMMIVITIFVVAYSIILRKLAKINLTELMD
ncbi:putative ABC transport system permease protein [Spiroplasma chinense]|uniref:Putative ABC transport system permease protein n=1 Tax=Spiroplasma chinense TaxID=216932 RepID=A0A5B9Y426_9MOLU|nr:ABC transporter permease [Spiroplasma chinense]QEH61781.1 putative ABC transport system permease protein [Spiroplasma chinense]